MDYERDRVNRFVSRNTKIIIGLLVFAIIAGILQGVGYATPGWLVFSGTSDSNVSFSVGMGFWYQRFCTDSCEIGHMNSALFWSKDDKKEFDTYKLIATLAVVSSISVPITLPIYLRKIRLQGDITSMATTNVLFSIVAGVLALVVVGKTASDVHAEYELWVETEKDTDFKLGFLYSAMLMGLGGTLNVLIFIALCVQIYYRKRDINESDREDESVGMT
ncbi:uncharacterized protein LOC132746630 [Ruditapes philippinarum]|uniref:uncharacterized protein LOC132746630 n=1 Tax=Ruditapes philippinarum TaxID=129788 RepID=UPI00295AB14E|nr:uncharacterized protein LOC132746630 [Ruditapes philippinarum]